MVQSFIINILLPLSVHVIVYFLVSDGEHDNEDPEEHHADHELVEDPHGDHGPVDGAAPILRTRMQLDMSSRDTRDRFRSNTLVILN